MLQEIIILKDLFFAASSSTYGDSEKLPKIEDEIETLSPYAITKYVNELYAEIFKNTYDLDYIGLRYFNVFGRRQDPNGPYAVVIPIFVKQLMKNKSPVINGDGSFSRDFTYVDNIIQANILCLLTKNNDSLNTVYNIACGERNSLNEIVFYLKEYLAEFNPRIMEIILFMAQIGLEIYLILMLILIKQKLLNYNPTFTLQKGLKESIKWYWNNL